MTKNYNFDGIKLTPDEAQLLDGVVSDDKAHFSKKDIKELIHSMRHPSKQLRKDTDQFDKEMRASYLKHERKENSKK